VYGDEEKSGSQLRSFVHNEAVAAVQGHAFQQRRQQELAAGQALVASFKEREPDWADGGVVEGAMTQQLKNEQIADLEAAKLLDQEQFREKNGRYPTDREIFNWHLDARALGLPVRSVGDLFESSATAERKTGLRRRLAIGKSANGLACTMPRFTVHANAARP
jgi:hypothetical protein